jgi:hypothetical protein
VSSISLSTAIPKGISQRWLPALWVVLGVVALGQLLLQLPLLGKSDRHITTLIAIDDTYYYLQTAWNLRHLGFATFDGLNPTNGVQFLWFLLLSALSFLAENKAEFLRLAIAACVLCNVLSYLVIARIGQLLHSPLLALVLAALWTGQTFLVKRYLWAMENSLHALVFWCVLWQMAAFFTRLRAGERPNLWGLTLVLILNGWARLDAALFSVVLYGYCLIAWYRANGEWSKFWYNHAKSILATAGLAGGAFIVQLLSFQWMGGSYLPVSALVKTGERTWQGEEAFATLADYFALSLPPELLPDWPDALLVLVGVGILAALAGLLYGRPRAGSARSTTRHIARDVWSGLLIAFVAYHGVVWISGARYEGYFTWYRSPLYIFWMFSVALLGTCGLNWAIARWQSRWGRHVHMGAAGVMLVAIVLVTGWRSVHSPLTGDAVPHHLYSVRYDIALWLRDNFPPGTILAAWNAGQLGYFSDKPVVNLDGLINSAAYYEQVLAGDMPLEQYLQESGVMFIVDYEDNPLTRSLPLIYNFPQSDERQMKIWQIPQ